MAGGATPAALGFLLGWSVAWPPGPVNAELIRRSLRRGFRPAVAVGLGAVSGDVVWALLIAAGAGTLLGGPFFATLRLALAVILLGALALIFARGAWRSFREWRAGRWRPAESRFDSARGGYLLGLGITLSSPWNLAFWLAVMGRGGLGLADLRARLLFVSAVLAGALSWCLLLCAAVVFLKRRFVSPLWEIGAQAATSLVLAWFAVQPLASLASF